MIKLCRDVSRSLIGTCKLCILKVFNEQLKAAFGNNFKRFSESLFLFTDKLSTKHR